jgi:hypothetical protein
MWQLWGHSLNRDLHSRFFQLQCLSALPVRSDSQRDEGERHSTGKISSQVRYARRFAWLMGTCIRSTQMMSSAAVMHPVIGSSLVCAVEKARRLPIWQILLQKSAATDGSFGHFARDDRL